MRGLDAITFDTTGLTLRGDDRNSRIWMTDAGDLVTVYDLRKPPGFRAVADDLDSIRAASRRKPRPMAAPLSRSNSAVSVESRRFVRF